MRITTAHAYVGASFFALLLCACGGGENESPQQSALDSALSTWAGIDSTHYQYVSQRACECLPEFTEPIIVEVVDGAVESAVFERDLQPVSPELMGTLKTVDELFAVIQAAIDEGAYSIDVTYESETGVPRSIVIDYDQNAADEELYLDIRDFEVIASVGI